MLYLFVVFINNISIYFLLVLYLSVCCLCWTDGWVEVCWVYKQLLRCQWTSSANVHCHPSSLPGYSLETFLVSSRLHGLHRFRFFRSILCEKCSWASNVKELQYRNSWYNVIKKNQKNEQSKNICWKNEALQNLEFKI